MARKSIEHNSEYSSAAPPVRAAGNPAEPSASLNNILAGEQTQTATLPEILAPAGDMPAALAAFAAGADAVYLGLKHFSARMQAENFSTTELARLISFAHAEKRRVYVAMNTLLKPGDPPSAMRLARRLALLGEDARPDALIVQDLGMLELARHAGYTGELHLSTLANVTHQKALLTAKELGAARIILPRELSIDEVRLMNAACPEDLSMEFFVHGALCFCVSGRCWWSSYMGGKSGLRGRCVQPCRRVYTQKGREGRFFSCMDLSLDVLARQLLTCPKVSSWKIEGRRKGPHYVYYATTAYRLLRDDPDNPAARREAEQILDMALGRPGTRSLFLPQRVHSPTTPPPGKEGQTSSGLLCGKIGKGVRGMYELRPRLPLLPKDYLRVGYEDESWHCTVSITKWVPQGGAFTIGLPRGKNPRPGTPVFLIDRKEPELLTLLAEWNRNLMAHAAPPREHDEDIMALTPPVYTRGKGKKDAVRKLDITLASSLPHGRDAKSGIRPGTVQGLWLSPKAHNDISQTLFGRISWWLPPVIWPDEEDAWSRLIASALRKGARHFVCNAPWQVAFFPDKKDLALTAGPFCNIANAPALAILARLGFNAAMISPELGQEDILSLPGQSPLPLGIVLSGYWPMGITRHGIDPLKQQDPFQSPKGEEFWARRYGQNVWLYPSWPLDLASHRPALERAGYSTFVAMTEHPPKGVVAKRTSEFNWNVDVL